MNFGYLLCMVLPFGLTKNGFPISISVTYGWKSN